MPLKIKPDDVIIANLGLSPNGPVQVFFTNTCARHMDKYVPFDEGNLSMYRIESPDTIVYEQPYATYQWRGERADGTHKINEANRNRSMHPLATSNWPEKMWTAEKDDVVKEVAEFARRIGAK